MKQEQQALNDAKQALVVAAANLTETLRARKEDPCLKSAWMWQDEEREHAEAVALAERLVADAEMSLANSITQK